MSDGNSITSVAALALIGAVARLGKPVAPLFELVGLDPAAPPNTEHHLAADTYYDVWERAMQLVQDPTFPVRVGTSFDLEALEAFGFLAMSCETLRDAYERTARVRSLYNVGSRWELEVEGELMRMIWLPWPIKVRSELARRSVNEYQVAEMLASICQMTQRRLVPRRIAFRHSAPRDVSAHQELLGRAPEFEASYDGFEVELGWLAEPIRGKNPKLRAYFEKQCERARAAFESDPAFTALVRQRLAANMEGGGLSMAEVARSLGTSPRSLHRRLADEGTSFNDLLDEVRRQFAEQYLARPRLAVTEVAYLVGFNDPSAFFKAFRRWTGVTPSEYRTSLLDPALLDPALPVQTG
jgi:AraC-like DNA-binding protein